MEFRDLKRQYEELRGDIDARINSVISSTRFISGPEVRELEEKLAEYCGVKHCITCANGTDALTIALMAWGIGKDDAVFVPDYTFFSTAESPALVGATPIFVDINEDTYNMDAVSLEDSIRRVIEEGRYEPKVVVAVDLFGQPAEYDKIQKICKKYGLKLLEDGAQGFGGNINGKRACSFGDISTTSFFPAKPLGCYGDGGAIFTNSDEWANTIRSICVHGKGLDDKYNNVRVGMNSRLDTIQAAILLAKLDAFINYELTEVNKAANNYNELLRDSNINIPVVLDGYYSSWAQYTIQLPDGVDRNTVQENLRKKGIPTMVYYKKPIHEQEVFRNMNNVYGVMRSSKICKRVLNLPISPYIEQCEIESVVMELKKCL